MRTVLAVGMIVLSGCVGMETSPGVGLHRFNPDALAAVGVVPGSQLSDLGYISPNEPLPASNNGIVTRWANVEAWFVTGDPQFPNFSNDPNVPNVQFDTGLMSFYSGYPVTGGSGMGEFTVTYLNSSGRLLMDCIVDTELIEAEFEAPDGTRQTVTPFFAPFDDGISQTDDTNWRTATVLTPYRATGGPTDIRILYKQRLGPDDTPQNWSLRYCSLAEITPN